MGLFDPIVTGGLARVERIERSLGPNVALPLLWPFLEWNDPEIRRRAMLAIFRCLVSINDARELAKQAVRWSEMRGGEYLDDIIDLCKALISKGHTTAATTLAGYEVSRDPKARGVYFHARCLERASDPSFMDVYKLAAERAEIEPGAELIGAAARARRIEKLASDPSTLAQAIAEAQAANPEHGLPSHKLVIAAARLASTSRFTRAGGLSILEDLAKKARPEFADLAMRMAAQHVDEHAEGISAVELDRIAVILKHWRDPKERDAALARLKAIERIASAKGEELEWAIAEASEAAPETLPILRRARAIIEGGGQGLSSGSSAGSGIGGSGSKPDGAGSPDASPRFVLAGIGLDIVAAIRRGRLQDASSALARASVAQKAYGGAAPPSIWTGACLGLRSLDRGVQQGAIGLVEVLLGAPNAAPPPPVIKLGSLAASLRLLGRMDLAESALRGAAIAKEPGAAAELALGLARQGWALAERGEREAALAALREAKELSRKLGKAGLGGGHSP